MNENMDTKVEKLRPFTRFCMTIGELPTSYLMSMTYYEQIIWFTKYLQETVIPAINNNATAVEEIQNFLKTLDLQDEVDNKLDEMAESGELQEIMAAYLNTKAIFGFDNVASMKEATNLIDGSYAETLGYYSKNDGGKALYKVRQITNDDVVDEMLIIALYDDNLIAELIAKDEVNVRQLGAKGDGISNDTNYLQTAIDNFKIIDLGVGNYLVNSQLNIDNDGRHIKGSDIVGLSSIQGKGKTNILVNHSGKGIYVNNSYGQNFEGCYFEGFSIIASGDAVSSASAIGLHIHNWNHCTLKNLGIYNFQGNVGVEFSGSGQYSYVTDCKFADSKYCIYIPDSYPGLHITHCMFDGNRNGSDNNQNPRAGAYCIYTNGGGEIIDSCRFQGFETCIYSNGVQNVITKCRFEMFNYGIKVMKSRNYLGIGNTFDRYMGDSETKIAIYVDAAANNTIIEPFTATSCQPVAVVNNNDTTIRNDIKNFNMQLGTISDECEINFTNTSYAGLLSRVSICVSNATEVGNLGSNYWIISGSGWSSYWESANKHLIGNTPQQIVPQATGTSGSTKNTFRLIFRKHGNPDPLENLLIYGQIERY